MNTRTESDSIGTLQVPADAYYGVQSLRASQNFPLTGQRMHTRVIYSLAQIKKAAALTTCAAGQLARPRLSGRCWSCSASLPSRLKPIIKRCSRNSRHQASLISVPLVCRLLLMVTPSGA